MNCFLTKEKYYHQQLEILFKHNLGIWASNVFAPIGIAFLFKDFFALYYLLSFILLQLFIGFLRHRISINALKTMKEENQNNLTKYLNYYLFLLFISSTLYGIISAFIVFNAQELQVYIMLCFFFGLISGAFVTISSVYLAIVLYMIPFAGIFIASLLIYGEASYYMISLLLCAYLIITLGSSYKIFLSLKNNIEKTQIISKQKEELISNQNQLIDAAKMVSIGEMMANITHQWRQPLSAITILASGLKLQNELNMQIKKEEMNYKMDDILTKAEYLSETINTFRNFLKENKEEENIVLQDRLKLILQIVQANLNDSHIKVNHNFDDSEKLSVKMIKGELDQVVINILNNAKDALIENKIKKPLIIFKIQKLQNIVLISIEDNAGGIKEDIIDKIFDPYFTTKSDSKGTGLGLHMSYKIMNESLKGKLNVSNTNKGAKFTIELPLINKED